MENSKSFIRSIGLNMKFRITSLCSAVKTKLNHGHNRSVNAKKNIIGLVLIKGASILINLFLVPLTINYINPTKYGIWITLTSIIGWFSFFDIGFGHGLRNKFAESVAKGEYETARIYVSTTYFILAVLVGILLAIFLVINPILDWVVILNTSRSMANELSLLALILFTFFCIQFVLQLITTVMTANQDPAKASLLQLLGSALSLILIFVVTKTTSGNLIYLGIIVSACPVLILIVSSLWFYKHEYRMYAPSIKHIKLSHGRNLMGLGIKFFIIQIGAVIFFQTDNIIISQLFGPEEVTVFNITFKLFSIIIMLFSIIVAPLWSAFTDAYTKSDFVWINSTFAKVKNVWLIFVACTIVILITSPIIIRLWVGENVKVPFMLSVAMCMYVIAITWQSIHVYFLNGIGKIQIQLYLVIISGLINIPLAI